MKQSTQLQRTLFLNGSFSLSGALFCLLFPNQLAESFAVSISTIFSYVGLGLLLFASFVLFVAWKKSNHVKTVQSIIVQDILWVIASFAVLFTNVFELSEIGNITIAVIAIIVALFAAFQWYFVKKID